MKNKWWIFLVVGVVILVGLVAWIAASIGRNIGRAEALAEKRFEEEFGSEVPEELIEALDGMGEEIESALTGASDDIESALTSASEEIESALSGANEELDSALSGANEELDSALSDANEESGEKALTAEADFAGQTITEVQVDWVVGDVTIVPGDHVSLKEYSASEVEGRNEISYSVTGTVLVIREYKEADVISFGADNSYRPSKDLVLTLPAGLQKLTMDIVAADVTAADSLAIDTIKINGVSSEITFGSLTAREVDLDVVEAEIALTFAQAPELIELDSVGGTLTITLPEGTGYRVDMDSLGGELVTSSGSSRGNVNTTVGDGKVEIDIETMSSKIVIQ